MLIPEVSEKHMPGILEDNCSREHTTLEGERTQQIRFGVQIHLHRNIGSIKIKIKGDRQSSPVIAEEKLIIIVLYNTKSAAKHLIFDPFIAHLFI